MIEVNSFTNLQSIHEWILARISLVLPQLRSTTCLLSSAQGLGI